MSRTRLVNALVLGLLVVAAGMLLTGPAGPLADLVSPLSYENATVEIHDENETTLATVDVRIADTDHERYVGLSETDALAAGDGMLFVHEQPGTYTYVMREMAFPIDIVFIADNGTITTIHHAPVAANPSDPADQYRGQGRYVLEVPCGWTNATGIEVGDRVSIPDSAV